MAQGGFTPIQLYYSSTASAAPAPLNLASGELAINITDGKLYYKDNLGAIQTIADKAYSTRVTTISFGSIGLTPSTATSGAVTVGGTLGIGNGGTGQSTQQTAINALVGTQTANRVLRSDGTNSTLSQVALATDVTGTLPTANGGTNLTSFTANGVVYASSSSALTTGSALTFDGSNLGLGVTSSAWFSSYKALEIGSTAAIVGSTPVFMELALALNCYRSSSTGNWVYRNNGVASRYFQDGAGAHAWDIAPSGTAGTAITFTRAMTLDASGNLSMAAAGAITSSRINPRTSTTASTATLSPNIQTADQYNLTAQAVGLTVAAPTGTPVDGNKLLFRILDNGSAQTITWNATYTAIGVTLPTATTANKTLYVGCIYNAYGSSGSPRWDVIAVTTQA
jgi:hypothetical protein